MWDFLYPNVCRHCGEGWGVLCAQCLEHVEWLKVEKERCQAFEGFSCFEKCGPVLSLCREKDMGAMKASAALMVLQYEKLGWVECDGVAGFGMLGEYFRKISGLTRAKKPWTDKTLLVVSLKPVDFKQKRRIFENYPRKIVSLSLV